MDDPAPGQVTVIGLGLIGSRLARRLRDAGFKLRGYDIDPGRLTAFERMGGTAAGSPAEAVAGCEAAFLSLPDSDASRVVCLGEGGLASTGVTGLRVYDTTTGRPEDAIDIAADLTKRGIVYCDATLSGNSAMAERGELTVLVGGPVDAYQHGVPVFETIGRSHHHLGDVGSGSRMKLLVNHVLAVHRLALAEGLVVAESAGLDPAATLEVLKDSAAYSRAMDIWGEPMIDGAHDPPSSRLRQGHKDARLIVEHAAGIGVGVDLIQVVRSVLDEGERAGLGDLDNSAVIEVLRRRAGRGRLAR